VIDAGPKDLSIHGASGPVALWAVLLRGNPLRFPRQVSTPEVPTLQAAPTRPPREQVLRALALMGVDGCIEDVTAVIAPEHLRGLGSPTIPSCGSRDTLPPARRASAYRLEAVGAKCAGEGAELGRSVTNDSIGQTQDLLRIRLHRTIYC